MTAADLCRERGWEKGQLLLLVTEVRWDRTGQTIYRIVDISDDGCRVRELGWKWTHSQKWNLVPKTSEVVAKGLNGFQPLDRLPWETPSISNIESVPVDPAVQAKVASILKEKGFKEYQ